MDSVHSHNLFEQLADQEFTSEGIRPGGFGLTQRGLDLARLGKDDEALDIGCGTGVTVAFLIREHSIRAVGIDSSPLLVAMGRAGDPGRPIFQGEAESLPFADESFAGILLECTLSLVADRRRVLRECRRVLKPFGRIILTDLYAGNPEGITDLRSLSAPSCLRGALDKDLLLQELSSSGFGSVCFEDHSELLRDFAVRMIWTFGSLDRFLTGTARCDSGSGDVAGAVRRARPGYFLFVGVKACGTAGPLGECRTNELS